MVARAFMALFTLALAGCATTPSAVTSSPLVGTWRLESRIDRTSDGRELVEPSLGKDPIALLIYDSSGNVSAQLMRRNRSDPTPQEVSPADPNNSAALGGYDAYFGTYSVAEGTVTHVLQAALNPNDVGRHLSRHFVLKGDKLIIFFAARAADGSDVTRSLTWRRTAP